MTPDDAARALAALSLADKNLEAAEIALGGLTGPLKGDVDLEEARALLRMVRTRVLRCRSPLSGIAGPGV